MGHRGIGIYNGPPFRKQTISVYSTKIVENMLITFHIELIVSSVSPRDEEFGGERS